MGVLRSIVIKKKVGTCFVLFTTGVMYCCVSVTKHFFLNTAVCMPTGAFVEQVIALTEALEELPVIRKLDLRGNEAMGIQVGAARRSHSKEHGGMVASTMAAVS